MSLPELGRWPFLLGAALCIAAAVFLYQQTREPDAANLAAAVLLALGATLLGAFIATYRHHDDHNEPRA